MRHQKILYAGKAHDTACCSIVSLLHCRYELPGIHALNFVLEKSLGGGGVTSLRVDPQVC